MLDAWIIEEIERREHEEERPFLELPLYDEPPPPVTKPPEDEVERGVIVIDL